MSQWDCQISIERNTVVDADDEDQARAMALDWFFTACIHAVDERDVSVQRIEGDAA